MNRFLPIVVFVVTLSIGLGMTYTVYRFVQSAELARFEIVADDVVDRINERVTQHVALLVATRSLFVASDGFVSANAFRSFVAGLDIDGKFNGIQGIGYARYIPVGTEPAIETEILNGYDMDVDIWPETEQDYRAAIVLLEPLDERNRQAIGYDMYSNAVRRIAMDHAVVSGIPQASGPLELVQEVTDQKQAGFIVYLSLRNNSDSIPQEEVGNDDVEGFVYAPFRAGDLHMAALERYPRRPAVVETHDVTDGSNAMLFRSAAFDDHSDAQHYSVERSLNVAGRDWLLVIKSTRKAGGQASFLSVYLLGAVSLFFAAALAVSARSQLKAVEAASKLHAVSQKTVEEKELMLQEMKHRIKNSLARVLAISRQTASNSGSLDEFTKSFSARIQAMASAQDMLTRSKWNKADLRQLLEKELPQVFEDDGSRCSMEGPSVLLNEQSTQALGLTFHELATNAMKYGAMADDSGRLTVRWKTRGTSKKRRLVIEWIEEFSNSTEAPESSGFGTRLIDANIRGELSGEIDRSFDANGMIIVIDIPHTKVS